MALDSRGDIKYGDKGDMTKDEIDKTIELLIEAKKAGQFRAFWTTFDESVNLMASGEVVHPVDVVAGGDGGALARHPVLLRAAQGRLSGVGELPGPDVASEGLEARRGLRVPELVHVGLAGRLHRQAGLLQLGARDREEVHDARRVGLLVSRASRPSVEIKDPYGAMMEKPGAVRDGGSFWNRMGHVACWNTLMKENRLLDQALE